MAPPAPHLVDEILEEIFLRLPTPSALARVSTASPSFRRIITERSFLRRFRKLHPLPLLGFATDTGCLEPAQDPHPSAPLARALADAADFSYSFVPRPENNSVSRWRISGVRDGRVLLECSYRFNGHAAFPKLAVCDPLSRKYVLLPPIPEDITVQPEPLVKFDPILAPAAEDEDETMFKVICTAHYKSKLVVFVFSSAPGQWCDVASPSWSSSGKLRIIEHHWTPLRNSYYLSGSFYWTLPLVDKLLVLDTCRMELSTVNILPGYHVPLLNQIDHGICKSSIVIGTEGALEMIILVCDFRPNGVFYLYHTSQENKGESSDDFQLKNIIALPSGCDHYEIVSATEGFLFLRGVQGYRDPNAALYSLEIGTSEVKKVCRATWYGHYYSYFGFPPSLSKPSL